ncbi:MAG TPA: biotin--[acetyl-CoA-carboxylase] ligase [Actinomycetes bacterium]|nr:biotin--[acetyl-CoA-carboxylase] ligase [Actinomycetes bacterium]
MPNPYRDLDRPPLRVQALRSALVVEGGLWSRLDVVDETGSTNADLVAAAAGGAGEGRVLVAEHQVAGKGRLDRVWSAPERSALTFSVLLRPPPGTRAAWGWLPLLAGLSVVGPVRRLGEVDAGLKWPNDVLVGERKLAGLLAEVAGDAVVVGVGLNVSLREDELPVPSATSLAVAGSEVTDRDPVLRAVLRELATRYVAWRDAGGDAEACGLAADYRAACLTVGRDVTVHLPGGTQRRGRAVDVDATGRLVVAGPDGVDTLAAGDVVHLR